MRKWNLLLLLLLLSVLLSLPTAAAVQNYHFEKYGSAVSSNSGSQKDTGYIGFVRDASYDSNPRKGGQYVVSAGSDGIAWLGYTFKEPFSMNTLIFTSGDYTADGGWFRDGQMWVEICRNGEWMKLVTYPTPEIPVRTTLEEAGAGVEQTVFNFEPVMAEGIRIAGVPAGEFFTCVELEVLCDVDITPFDSIKDFMKLRSAADSGTWIESIGKPIAAEMNPDVSGGSRDINKINDGEIPTVGQSSSHQYDTVSNAGKSSPGHSEYIGYMFSEPYCIDCLEFTEGGNFFDGGWFRDGSMEVEVSVDYQWVSVPFSCTPEYPNSDKQEDFLPDYDTYTLTLNEPVTARGVRVSGIAGGSAYFISCGELRVHLYQETKDSGTQYDYDPLPEPPERTSGDTEIPAEKPVTVKSSPALIAVWSVVGVLALAVGVVCGILAVKRKQG